MNYALINDRSLAIDALRGYAIITMVLSATVVGGILPGWMYHCQEPPPTHAYDAAIAGVTWVDLVFPAFLFAMGAALPFSVGKRRERGESLLRIMGQIVWRAVLLTYFAILVQHFYPYVTSGGEQSWRHWLMALACFVAMFPMFMRLPKRCPAWLRITIQLSALLLGLVAMLAMRYPDGTGFDPHRSNIILLIMANVALWGSLLYLFTIGREYLRWVLLLMLAALFLSSTVPGSWAEATLKWTPLDWFYQPWMLKYLFIVIPAAYAGELVRSQRSACPVPPSPPKGGCNDSSPFRGLGGLCLALIISNLALLYTRHVLLNMAVSAVLLLVGWLVLRRGQGYVALWRGLFALAAALLVIGLLIEPFEGGIKKDPPTFSYLLVMGALSCFLLIVFSVVCDAWGCRRGTRFLTMSGQNPMVAYVASDLCIIPLLQLTGIWPFFAIFAASPWLGFLHGVILTSLAVLVTMLFTRLGCLWRT